MSMQLVCTSKNMWAELSYEFGPSCLINLGRVGMGRVLCGPSWHGPSWFWAELSVILYHMGRTVRKPVFGVSTKQDPNQSPQLQALARKLKFLVKQAKYDTFQKANNKGADQTVWMRSLVCAFVVRKHWRQGFSHQAPYSNGIVLQLFLHQL